jgi:transcriptional regulator GlxA family with amidase domain
MTSDGVALLTKPVAALRRKPIDTLIVPGALDVAHVTQDAEMVAWIRRRAPRCRRVCSVCVGTFALAAAGLLEGRKAVTHWAHCATLSARYPGISVDPDAIFVRDGALWSSAGVTTGIDLVLALIDDDVGHAVAMHVAWVLVVYLRRSGGQSQYSVLLSAQVESDNDKFAELDRWVSENLTADLRVERLAERAGMSPRNFARRYAAQRKLTPARSVEAIRVEAARRELEHSDDRIEAMARRCGFTNAEQLRQAFARHVGIPPRAYRARFASPERAPTR